jgi:F-type H+-transporting ATPase subunit delta
VLPTERKRALVEHLLAERTDPRAMMLLEHWIDLDQGGHLSRLVDETIAAAAARRDRIVATVTTAVPLDADQRGRLAETFGRLMGKPVDLQVEIDPGVVGSLSVRIGDEVYDGTVKRQLERARELLGAA